MFEIWLWAFLESVRNSMCINVSCILNLALNERFLTRLRFCLDVNKENKLLEHHYFPKWNLNSSAFYYRYSNLCSVNKVAGIFDVTSLALMPWFDIVVGMVPDYMHGCLLGITKTLLYKWLSASNYKQPYFIGGHVSAVELLFNVVPIRH